MIEFETIGGVGDGDPTTGSGTDNARAFARAEAMAQQGYGIKFKSRACYKTTEQINAHDMYWIGDTVSRPIIFGWFSDKGKKIIGRSKGYQPLSVCVIGIKFHRCGPYAEHGIVIDNIKNLYFDIAVTSDPGAQGGAIGISPFYPENRQSRNCYIKAEITNSGDYGVQFGSVNGAVVDVSAVDCYREVIGIEPIVKDSFEVGESDIVENAIFPKDVRLSNAQPILYCRGVGPRGPLVPGKHYFIIENEDRSISLSDSRSSSLQRRKLDLSGVGGSHYFVCAAVVENVFVRSANIVDNQSKKPSLYANTMGYIVVTGNSGGIIDNVKFGEVYIEGNQIFSKSRSIGLYVQGVQNLTIDNVKVRGCDDGIVVGDGWLNGMFDQNGRPIRVENGYAKLLSKNVFIVNPDLVDYRKNGVLLRGSGGAVLGGSFRSRVRDGRGLSREVFDRSTSAP
ncbi:hypothetical protein TPR58_12905 [Sphingomonas sp. HF-S3]|uniref:Right-handed parallel beta-helix repeat-containing protein n=1 Tax=Sphingomonas rustica TaxID=3103142 RepID=A0ABV0B932_9SPHN